MHKLVTQEQLSFAEEPIELVGPPRRCVGTLSVHNPQPVGVKLRQLRLRTPAPQLAACGDAIDARVRVPLCPGETRRLRVRVTLPPSTPPGTYQAQLDGGETSARTVTIRVLPRRKLRVTPRAVAITAAAGACVTTHVTVVNLGNVETVIPKRAALELHVADRIWTHYFHAAVRSHGEDGYEPFLDSFVKRMQRDEPALGRARVLAGAGPLAPQQVRVIEVELRLPPTLRARRRYRAQVRLGGAAVRVALQIAAANPSSSAAR